MSSDPHGTNREPVLVIVNPTSGCGRGARGAAALTAALQARGIAFTRRDTNGPGHARELAAAANGLTIVVGGDGTLHEVVNGLPRRGAVLAPFAVLPCGSGDDFAMALGCTHDAAKLAALLHTVPPRAVDLGQATLDGIEHRFTNFAGLGLVADVAARACRRRVLRGKLLYVAATLAALVRPARLRADLRGVDADGVAFATNGLDIAFASISNGPTFGGGLPVAPGALMDDGALDLVHVEHVGRLASLGLVAKLLRARHVDDARFTLRRVRSLTIALREPAWAALDGEPMAKQVTSAEFTLEANGLDVRGVPVAARRS